MPMLGVFPGLNIYFQRTLTVTQPKKRRISAKKCLNIYFQRTLTVT